MVDNGHTSRKQRRAAERKERILKAASHLFSQKGFKATTIKEVAELADISEGTIYNYFDDKEHLFTSLMDMLIEEQNECGMYTKSMPSDPRSFLYSVFEVQHQFINDNRELMRSILSEVLINETYREKFYTNFIAPAVSFFILHFQARGVLGQIRAVNHLPLSHSLVAIILGFYILELLDDQVIEDDWENLLGETISLLYEGLSIA